MSTGAFKGLDYLQKRIVYEPNQQVFYLGQLTDFKAKTIIYQSLGKKELRNVPLNEEAEQKEFKFCIRYEKVPS